MSWTIDKATGDIVISGFSKGIAPSPHVGIGAMQAVNITTEQEEVMGTYMRAIDSSGYNTSTGTVTAIDTSHVLFQFSTGSYNTITAGVWVTISGSTISGLSNGTYYVLTNENGFISATIATTYNGSAVTGMGSTGTATFVLVRNMGLPVASATEPYGVGQYRYYVLDNQGLVWVRDTATVSSSSGLSWFLPDTTTFTNATGIAVINGWLAMAANNTSPSTSQTIWFKQTVNLGPSSPGWSAFAGGPLASRGASNNPHFMLVGNQSTLYYTDGNFVGSLFPTSGTPNIFSYCSYTSSSTTGTISSIVGGTLPTVGSAATRIPAIFFPSSGGTNPTALSAGTIYYIAYSAGAGTFEVYAAASGGAALDIDTGKSGTLYFNTFGPIYGGAAATYVWTPQALTLPFNEVSQSMAELGNLVVVGCRSNVVYQWDQVAPQAAGFVYLPENNVVNIITVNNMGYAFAGSRGNIYVTNGSTASLAMKVPDYTSGLVEPYFVWGGAMFLRGRVYFSIQDQISGHTGQCGGVWSFIPTENYIVGGENVGSALHIENQNSYGTYNGMATVLLPSRDQAARGPQYFSGWASSISSPLYGIDKSSDSSGTAAVIETDVIPVGTFLNKGTIKQVEYKLSTPLTGIVRIKWRNDLQSAFSPFDSGSNNPITETGNTLSGYYVANFEKQQWVQLQVTITEPTTALPVFNRLTELRIR